MSSSATRLVFMIVTTVLVVFLAAAAVYFLCLANRLAIACSRLLSFDVGLG